MLGGEVRLLLYVMDEDLFAELMERSREARREGKSHVFFKGVWFYVGPVYLREDQIVQLPE